MNAADHFGIEDLRKACAGFSSRVIGLHTVCSLLLTAENYIQYKSTKIFVQRVTPETFIDWPILERVNNRQVMEFVEENGESVLSLPELVHLPRHVLELILSREGLRAQQLTKYRAAERWARHHLLEHPSLSLRELMKPLVRHVAFAGIPTSVLVREIQPLGVVPDHLLMAALAYQADPHALPRRDRQPNARHADPVDDEQAIYATPPSVHSAASLECACSFLFPNCLTT